MYVCVCVSSLALSPSTHRSARELFTVMAFDAVNTSSPSSWPVRGRQGAQIVNNKLIRETPLGKTGKLISIGRVCLPRQALPSTCRQHMDQPDCPLIGSSIGIAMYLFIYLAIVLSRLSFSLFVGRSVGRSDSLF